MSGPLTDNVRELTDKQREDIRTKGYSDDLDFGEETLTMDQRANVRSWRWGPWWDRPIHLTPKRCIAVVGMFVPFFLILAVFVFAFFVTRENTPNAVCVFTDVQTNRTDTGDQCRRVTIVMNATIDVYSPWYASKNTPWSRVITAKSVDAAETKIMQKYYVGRRVDCWASKEGIQLKWHGVTDRGVAVFVFAPLLVGSFMFPFLFGLTYLQVNLSKEKYTA